MRKLLVLAPFVFAASLAAQNCMDRNYGLAVGNGDDVMMPIQSIGFAFPFCGATYTDVHVSTNGFFHLSNGGNPAPGAGDGTSTAAELAGGSPRVCALWSDFNLLATNGANVYVKTTGGQCNITWDRAVNFGSTAPLVTFQAQLFATGEIRFFWEPGVTNNSTASALYAAGLCGVSPGLGATLPVASDLSAGGTTSDNTLYETWTATGFDMANNSLHLIPTSPGWVYLLTGAAANCSSVVDYGTGCVQVPDTFHELMPSGTFDLGGTTLTMLRQPGGYTALNVVPGAIVAPSATAAIVANGDDIEQTVTLSAAMPVANGTTNSLTICSNGRIALSPAGNGATYTPAVAAFVDFPITTIAADWHDYNPTLTGSGKVLFEEVAGIAYVTWDNVYSFGSTTPNRFQYQFNLATGDCSIVYGTVATAGNDHLVGYSVGGSSPVQLALDVSVALATPVAIFDVGTGLKLSTAANPIIGAGTFSYVIQGVPNVLPLAFAFFGDTQINPGIDLTVIGMPGCFAYTNANLVSVTVPVVNGSASLLLPIPNNPSLAGASLATQAVAFSNATPAGLVSSNGNFATIGF